MSQSSTATATISTPPMTIVCSGMSSFLSTVTMAPSLMGLLITSGEHDVGVLLPPLTPRHSEGVVGPANVPQQQPPSQMHLQSHTNYAMDSPQVVFSFGVELSHLLYFYVWCLFWCMHSAVLSRGNLLLLSQLFSSHSNYIVRHTALGAGQNH